MTGDNDNDDGDNNPDNVLCPHLGALSVVCGHSSITADNHLGRVSSGETCHYGHLAPGVITCHHMSRNVTDGVGSLTICLISRLSPRQLAALC